MYDPSIGRWLEEDPSGFDAGDANLYRYVGNGPTDATDPTGMNQVLSVSTIPPIASRPGSPLPPIPGLVVNAESGVTWRVKFHLSEPAAKKGVIVQFVRGLADVKDANGKDVTAAFKNEHMAPALQGAGFWEWFGPIAAGAKESAATDYDDSYMNPINCDGEEKNTKGWEAIWAVAAFYQGYQPSPAVFVVNNPLTGSLGAPSTANDPHLPLRTSTLVAHHLVITWDFTNGKKSIYAYTYTGPPVGPFSMATPNPKAVIALGAGIAIAGITIP